MHLTCIVLHSKIVFCLFVCLRWPLANSFGNMPGQLTIHPIWVEFEQWPFRFHSISIERCADRKVYENQNGQWPLPTCYWTQMTNGFDHVLRNSNPWPFQTISFHVNIWYNWFKIGMGLSLRMIHGNKNMATIVNQKINLGEKRGILTQI